MKRTHLVLSGGGVQGISMLASLSHIDITYVTHIVGSSAGAVIGALLCVCTPDEILPNIQHNPLLDNDNITIDTLFHEYGIADQKPILDIIHNAYTQYLANNDPTFKELYALTARTLIITGTNVSTQKCDYFDRHNTPNMKVSMAVKISMSIPFIFKQVTYNGQLYADGCLTNMYPHNAFQTIDPKKQLRVYCDMSAPPVTDLVTYAVAVVSSLLRGQGVIESESNTIFIHSPKCFSVLHKLSNDDVELLRTAGCQAALKFLKKHS